MQTKIVNLPGNRRIRQDEYVAFLREFETAIQNEKKPEKPERKTDND